MSEKLFDPEAFARSTRVHVAVRGISQRDAAKEVGVSSATFNRVCRGGVPDVETYLRVQTWMRTPPNDH